MNKITKHTTIRPEASALVPVLRRLLSAELQAHISITDAVSIAIMEAVKKREPWPVDISEYIQGDR